MLKFRNRIISILLASIYVFVALAVSVSAEPEQTVQESPVEVYKLSSSNTSISEKFELITENDKLAFYVDSAEGEFVIKVKATGQLWFSNPQDRDLDQIAGGELKMRLSSQLVLYYTQGFSEIVTTSATGCVKRGGLSMVKEANGVKFTYEFKDAGFTIPLRYTLKDDYLEVSVLLEEITPEIIIKEQTVQPFPTAPEQIVKTDINITKIDVLPFFGAGGSNDEGYLFVPDGAGGLINFNNGKTNFSSYKKPIYGNYMDVPSMSELYGDVDSIRMPVFGVHKNNDGFIAVITNNDAVGFINAMISGRETSYNTVFSSIQHKVIDKTSVGESKNEPLSETIVAPGDYTIRYYPLTGDDSDYSGMAATYQKYLMEEKNLKANAQAKENPLFVSLYGGVVKKQSVFGIMKNVLNPLVSYKDAINITKKLKDSGVDNMIVQYELWTKSKNRTSIQNKVTYESKLGGKSNFKKLASFLEDEGIQFYPKLDFVDYDTSANGYSTVFAAAKLPSQAPAYQTSQFIQSIFGRRWSLLKPTLVKEAANDFLKSYKKLGINGFSMYPIASTVYSDNTKGGTKRGETVGQWEEILNQYKTELGSVMVEEANAYAMPYVDYIVNAPIAEYGSELIDENIPFYQMVIHSLISYSVPAVNLTGDPQRTLLKAAETGSAIHFSFVQQNVDQLKDSYLSGLYSCDIDVWYDTAVNQYKRIDEITKKTSGCKIVHHDKLADGVYKTTYENGVNVIVNYNDDVYEADGKTVSAMDFGIFE